MRLQLSIHRHTLPPTHILFSTASHPASHTTSRNATISDLLLDVNDLVPLESEDGEWGLEDYIVEVATTADQEDVYEALHYQVIENVLREDDEVVIRYLKSDELRGRRYGGRLQITGDGRHLVDGVVWGKRWVAGNGVGRPGVSIPPRKRRRVLLDEGEDESVSLLGIAEELEDEEYVDDGKDDENEVKLLGMFDDADQEQSNEDDDGDDDDEMDVEEDEVQLLLKDAEEIEHVGMNESKDVLERQLRSRTCLGKRKRIVEVEMEDYIEDDTEAEAEFEGFSTPAKSPACKQVQFEDDQSGIDSGSDYDADSMVKKITVRQAQKAQDNLIEDTDEEESSEFERDSESGTSSSESGYDDEALPTSVKAVSVSHADDEIESEDEDKDDETSSSGSSESDSEESDTSVSSSDSNSESESVDDSAGNSSETTSESATSPNTESDSHTNKKKHANKVAKAAISPEAKQTGPLVGKAVEKAITPPGSGSTRTQKKNERNKKVARLNQLKELGHLPAHANFKDLEVYQAKTASTQARPVDDDQQLEAARAQVLASVQATQPVQDTVDSYGGSTATEQRENSATSAAPTQPPVEDTSSKAKSPTKHSEPSSQPATESSLPRNRLDVAATRRLLFGSLGVRNPKTKAEEAALREKLAKPTRQQQQPERISQRSNSPPPEAANGSNTDDSWKEKLIISAVECEKDGVKMEPPPFPFEQYWMNKKRLRHLSTNVELDDGEAVLASAARVQDMTIEQVEDATQRMKLQRLSSGLPNFSVRECFEALQRSDWVHDDALDLLWGAEASQGPGGSIRAQTQESQVVLEQVSNNGSRTVSFDKDEADGMPIPTEFEALADLGLKQILPGAIIAYKELHFGPETNFQPEISSYRVAKVTEVDDEGNITLTLAVRDRKQCSQRDPETGDLIVNNFQIRTSQEDEVDDGIRDISATDMIQAKLVEPTSQVPNRNATPTLRGGEVASGGRKNSSEVIPDSVPALQKEDVLPEPDATIQRIEIDTPRRIEITTMVKDAGFDSAMDEHLLEPFPEKDYELPPSSQHSAEEDTGLIGASDHVTIGETSQVHRAGRISSPLFPPQESEPAPTDAESFLLSDNPQSTSSPPVSPQLTVEYPHISQMELESSFHAPDESSKNSSSHQDAQRVPVVPTADLTLTTGEDEESFPAGNEINVPLDDESIDNPRAEVTQSPSRSQEASYVQPVSELDDDSITPGRISFLGVRGVDGPDSSPDSPHWDDENIPYSSDRIQSDKGSESEDSLPSLAELTSSQRRKISSKKSVLKYRSSASKKISSPSLLRKPKGKALKSVAEEDASKGKTKATRNYKERFEDLSYENSETSQKDEIKQKGRRKTRRNATPPDRYDGADENDYDLPLLDQIIVAPPASTVNSWPAAEVKIAPSQDEPPRMSQIPEATQIVDLTLSSDPLEPEDDSDDEWVDEHFERLGMGRARGRSSSGLKERKSTRSANEKGTGKGKVPGLAGSKSDLGAGTDGGKGVGTRRLLTSKKVRSQL